MKKIAAQWTGKVFVPYSNEDLDAAKTFIQNQIVNIKITGSHRPRSIQQNKWIFSIFRLVAENARHPEWDTVEKVKTNVKIAMRFFDEIRVVGDHTYFKLKSFAFDEMEQSEADLKYNQARDICAEYLKVDPMELQAQAQTQSL